MSDKNTFAKTLRALMTDKKLSQRALAVKLGITYQAVSTWCLGKNYPECDMLIKLAEFFGVSTDYLLTGIKPENQSTHDELGLSDEAIERLKYLHNDKEINEKLMPFVNALLSDKRFYSTFWKCLYILTTEINSFILRFTYAGNIKLEQIERDNPEIVAEGLHFVTQHCFYSMVDYFRKFFREHTDISKAESLYEEIKPRLFNEGTGDISSRL